VPGVAFEPLAAQLFHDTWFFDVAFALAAQGDARGRNNLGVMYATGRGVPQDDGEAFKWFRLAAMRKDAHGRNNLGVMYANGRGVPQDDGEALKWFRLAAGQGDARARHNIGVMHANGQGVPQDDREALKWFRLAAMKGDAYAQNNLGVMLRQRARCATQLWCCAQLAGSCRSAGVRRGRSTA
jgi:TPR repeat protein